MYLTSIYLTSIYLSTYQVQNRKGCRADPLSEVTGQGLKRASKRGVECLATMSGS